jgi:hypothetical protein
MAKVAGAMPEPDHALTAAVAAEPDRESAWLALAAWFRDNGRDEEAAAVRVFWPALRDGLAGGRTLERILEYVRVNAWRLGPQAREWEKRDGAAD